MATTTTNNNNIHRTGSSSSTISSNSTNNINNNNNSNNYNSNDDQSSSNDSNGPTLVRPNEVPDELICSICQIVPIQPVVLEPCSHIFCSYCINQSFIHVGQYCPIDRIECTNEQIQPITNNVFAYRLWCSIQVQCQSSMNNCSCTWSGSILDYAKSHRYKCQLNERRIKKRRRLRQQDNDNVGSDELIENNNTATTDSYITSEGVQKYIDELEYENNQLKQKVEQITNRIESMKRIKHQNEQNDSITLRPSNGVFDSTYSYDRTNISKLNTLIATYLEDKPSIIDQHKIFNCIKDCCNDYQKDYSDNPTGYKLDVRMLLSTAIASTWFTMNQFNRLKSWFHNIDR